MVSLKCFASHCAMRMAIKNEHSEVVEWLVKRFDLTIENFDGA